MSGARSPDEAPPDEAPRWHERLRDALADLTAIQRGLRSADSADPTDERWARLGVARELVESTLLTWEVRPADAPDGLDPVLAGIDAATGVAPGYPDVEEMAGQTPAARYDERTILLADLQPRLYAAAGAGLAELSIPELRALASHPDDMATLMLLAGLAARADAAIPEVTREAAVPQNEEVGPARGDPDADVADEVRRGRLDPGIGA